MCGGKYRCGGDRSGCVGGIEVGVWGDRSGCVGGIEVGVWGG